jgi:hypothetical protein
MAIATTKKRKDLIKLPDTQTKIIIHNKLVHSKYNYSLMQERVLNEVLKDLQIYRKELLDGKQMHQLDLFNNTSDEITFSINMQKICKPYYYKDLLEAIIKMASIIVKVPFTDHLGKRWNDYQGLFNVVRLPADNIRLRTNRLELRMKRDVAEMLVHIDMNNGLPRNYTQFLYEVCLYAENKYTARFYKLICSWKKKGGRYMSLEDLREWLDLGTKYKDFTDVRKRIIEPVIKELKKNADCWFECLEDYDGKKVVGVRFKVITPEFLDNDKKNFDYLMHLCRVHFKFTDRHCDMLQPIRNNNPDYPALIAKLSDLKTFIETSKEEIRNPADYILKSLLNEFV